MVEPVDIGIWNFWMQFSSDEKQAVYTCRRCKHIFKSYPETLPDTCPSCGLKNEKVKT